MQTFPPSDTPFTINMLYYWYLSEILTKFQDPVHISSLQASLILASLEFRIPMIYAIVSHALILTFVLWPESWNKKEDVSLSGIENLSRNPMGYLSIVS